MWRLLPFEESVMRTYASFSYDPKRWYAVGRVCNVYRHNGFYALQEHNFSCDYPSLPAEVLRYAYG
jgi:hypothetical protein